ncbi:hypothetical protein N9241_00850 [bacterium]|nr:hypothetical protein [bacterium]
MKNNQEQDLNYGYLDEGAAYWVSVYTLPEGAHITFEGEFPYSRYMSLSSYNSADAGVIDSIKDREIQAEAGSTNPFAEGNLRNDPSRSYLISLEPGLPPADENSAAENILYDGSGATDSVVLLFYRVYTPNTGRDLTGDVGLPRVTLQTEDGSIRQGEEACSVLNAGFEPSPVYLPEDIYANLRGDYDPSRNPPVFRTNYTVQFQVQCDFLGNCENNPERGPGLFSNADADYIYSFLNRNNGDVLVLRGQIPETPKTLEGNNDVFMEKELRYWSMCEYEYYSQKLSGCLYDEQIQINEDGFYTIVTSKQEDRPDNATQDCGVGYIPWTNDGDGLGVVDGRDSNPNDAWMVVRNILPASDFTQAIQNTSVSGDEPEVLGEYLPKGRYFSRAEFEGLGCNPWLALPYDQL